MKGPKFPTRKNFTPVKSVPFKEMLPLKLKPTVSGKGAKDLSVCCIYEMSVMFACLKNHEFNEPMCNKEINAFQQCYRDFRKEKNLYEERQVKGILMPGEKNITAKQLNKFLKQYPII